MRRSSEGVGRSLRISPFLVALAAALGLSVALRAEPKTHELEILVVHGRTTGNQVDKRLKKLAKELEPLKFKSLKLADKATFKLALGSSGRMQLPGKEWMTVRALGLTPDGKLRVEIEVKKLEFKATVAIAAGARVAVRGPAFEDGTLILAVKRVSKM